MGQVPSGQGRAARPLPDQECRSLGTLDLGTLHQALRTRILRGPVVVAVPAKLIARGSLLPHHRLVSGRTRLP